MYDNFLKKVKDNVRIALDEDIGPGDITSALLPEGKEITVVILARETCILAGRQWFEQCFYMLDDTIQIDWFFKDGDKIAENTKIATLSGQSRIMLTAERTALNFLQTLSAVATSTHVYVQAMKGKATLLDTRKTLPGLRLAQKYAVTCGGGENHRMGLFDAFLIKENHIRASGGLVQAIENAKKMNQAVKIEVEVETVAEYIAASKACPDVIMLDNFELKDIKDVVRLNKHSSIKLEVSGNINLHNIAKLAETGVDYISVGRITKSIEAIDLSMLIV